VIELRTGAQGPDLGRVFEWITDTDLLCPLNQIFKYLLTDTGLDKYPGAGHAALPGGAKIIGDDTVHRALEIGVIKHQDRRLAVQRKAKKGESV